MILDSLVGAQIRRFTNYPRFPDREGQAALKRAFISTCESDEQVVAVADRLERTLEFAPLPSDVWKAAEAISGELALQRQELDQARKQQEIKAAKPITQEGWWWETCANDPECPADTRRLLRSSRADVRQFAQSQARGINRWLWEHDQPPEYTEEEIKASVGHELTSNSGISSPNREEASL